MDPARSRIRLTAQHYAENISRPLRTLGIRCPEGFRIRRSPNDHHALGNRPHFCLGNALARLELSVTFNVLLDRLPGLTLGDVAESMNRPANFVSGYESLPVSFQTRA